MMRKLFKWLGYTLGAVLLLIVGTGIYLYVLAISNPPKPENFSVLDVNREQVDETTYTLGNNWLRKGQNGWWELYAEGAPFERGVIIGKLTKELVQYQEQAFVEQISKIVPSEFYRQFLRYLIAFFNRDLESNLTEEQRLEIYGISHSADPQFEYIGPAYQRLMNYHAAHDIGHGLQNLMLVGCTSFAAWDEKSETGDLIIGRNFDFFVGDKFAENKIVAFFSPESGHQFMMITWGGMTGAVSGMNREGLTVTINSAKSEIPSGSATPISLLAREILQYAATTQEAIEIAKKRQTFVAESVLIGSASENRAIVIEKTPSDMQVYEGKKDHLICANHYQSDVLGQSQINKEQMEEAASVYRQIRVEELFANTPKISPHSAAAILRDQKGQNGEFIGYGNEKSVNQLLAHHSLIFEPKKRLVWVASDPWQLGAFTAYDLNKVFEMKGLPANTTALAEDQVIPADTFLNTNEYKNYVEFRRLAQELRDGKIVDPTAFVKLNPEYFHAHVLEGNAWFNQKKYNRAKLAYERALSKEIATKKEENYIRDQIKKCSEKIS